MRPGEGDRLQPWTGFIIMYNHVSPKTILVAPCESKPWPVSPARSPGQPYCLHILIAPPTGPTCSSKSGSPAVGASVLPVLPTWMPVCQRGRRSANVDAFLASIQDFGGGRKNDNSKSHRVPASVPATSHAWISHHKNSKRRLRVRTYTWVCEL